MLCCAVTGELRPVIQELNVQGDLKNYTVSQRCHVAFHLSSEITGFQDIQFHTNATGGGLLSLLLSPHQSISHPWAAHQS